MPALRASSTDSRSRASPRSLSPSGNSANPSRCRTLALTSSRPSASHISIARVAISSTSPKRPCRPGSGPGGRAAGRPPRVGSSGSSSSAALERLAAALAPRPATTGCRRARRAAGRRAAARGRGRARRSRCSSSAAPRGVVGAQVVSARGAGHQVGEIARRAAARRRGPGTRARAPGRAAPRPRRRRGPARRCRAAATAVRSASACSPAMW